MKLKILTLFMLIITAASVSAQDLIDMLERDIKAERRSILAEAMDIPRDKETEFWALYNDLEQEFSLLTNKRANNIVKFAENYDSLSDKMAHEIAMTYYDVNVERYKIYKTYYKKMSKIIPRKDAIRFIQLLGQIQLLIDIQIAAELPLIK